MKLKFYSGNFKFNIILLNEAISENISLECFQYSISKLQLFSRLRTVTNAGNGPSALLVVLHLRTVTNAGNGPSALLVVLQFFSVWFCHLRSSVIMIPRSRC